MIELIAVVVAYLAGRIIGEYQTKKRFKRVYARHQRLINKGKKKEGKE